MDEQVKEMFEKIAVIGIDVSRQEGIVTMIAILIMI